MKIIASIFGLMVTAAVSAQTAAPVETFKFDLDSDVTIYKFNGLGSIVEVDTTLTYDVTDRFTFGLNLPVYNDSRGGDTGFGDINAVLGYDLFDGNCEFIQSDACWVDLGGAFGLPLGGEYSSNDITFDISATVGARWGQFSVSYAANYTFVDEYTYVAPMGGFVFSDVYTGVLGFDYTASSDLNLGVDLTQYSTDNQDLWVLAPSVEYQLSNAWTLSAEIGIPVSENIKRDADVSLSAGLSFQF